jgi:hypothetical protein
LQGDNNIRHGEETITAEREECATTTKNKREFLGGVRYEMLQGSKVCVHVQRAKRRISLMSEIVDPVLSRVEEVKPKRKTERQQSAAAIDHLPILARHADGNP